MTDEVPAAGDDSTSPAAPARGDNVGLRVAATASVILAFAGVVLAGAVQTQAVFITDVLGPKGFLYFVVGGLVLSSIVSAIVEWRLATARLAAGVGTEAAPGDLSWIRFFATAVGFAAYLMVLPFGGFLVSTAAYSMGTAAIAGERSKALLAAIAVLVPLGFVIVFEVLLNIELPGGRTGLFGN